MAREPTDLVLELLREIRAKLAEHDERFDELDKRFNALDQRLAELGNTVADWQETMAGAAGLSIHADSRDSRIAKRLADLTRRVEKLEEARRTGAVAGAPAARRVPAMEGPSTVAEAVAGDEIPDALVAGDEAALAPYKAVRRALRRTR